MGERRSDHRSTASAWPREPHDHPPRVLAFLKHAESDVADRLADEVLSLPSVPRTQIEIRFSAQRASFRVARAGSGRRQRRSLVQAPLFALGQLRTRAFGAPFTNTIFGLSHFSRTRLDPEIVTCDAAYAQICSAGTFFWCEGDFPDRAKIIHRGTSGSANAVSTPGFSFAA